MELFRKLDIGLDNREVITFVGGGGKTTCIFCLAKEIKSINRKVLISTTTKIYIPRRTEYDYLILKNLKKDFIPKDGSITIIAEEIIGNKLKGMEKNKLEEIISRNIFDMVLLEGDGAKKKPIKAPNEYEPIVLDGTTKTIGIIGLDSMGKELNNDNVHRVELFQALVNKLKSDIIDENDIVELVLNDNGLFKNSIGKKILLLNKANDEIKILKAKKIKNILNCYGFQNILIGDIKNKMIIR